MKKSSKDSMVFFGSFFDAIKDLPAEEFKKCACAILGYGLKGDVPEGDGIEKLVFCFAKPIIDSANARYKTCVENGKKGGRPRKETKACSSQKNQTGFTRENLNENVNENVNANENDNSNANANENENAPVITSSGESADGTHACGEYSNVFLNKSEEETLIELFGKERFDLSVEHLSRYIKRKPSYRSANHFEDLRGWVQKALDERGVQPNGQSDSTKGGVFDFDLSEIFER